MATPRNSRWLRTIPLIVTICLVNISAHAQTSRYIFLPDQSTLVQTGGIAGVQWTYAVEGQFLLTVDSEAGTASFTQVDANAVDDSSLQRTLGPNEVFNMTALAGTIVDGGTSIRFEGNTDDGSSVLVTLTFADDTVNLKGQTTPPPNSADFFIFTLDAAAQRKYSGGTSEPNDPYQIATAEDLMLLGDSPEDYDKHFILTADIDLDPNLPGRKVFDRAVIAPDSNPNDWQFNGTPFIGTFNGNGHAISRLTIAGKSYLGLFGRLHSRAIISNLRLEGVDVDGKGDHVGGLLGSNGGSFIGGGTVTQCYSTGKISGYSYVGGLVGDNVGGSTSMCYSEGTVNGIEWVGGLMGNNHGSIGRSHSTGTVSGSWEVGGLVGYNGYYGNINSSYSTSTVSGGRWNIGGLVGKNEWGSITISYSAGAVSGHADVGGLVGYNGQCGNINSSYSTGTVNGTGWDVGGLVGCNDRGSIAASFWDVQTSGQATSAGGTGLATSAMQDINTYLRVGWDLVDETFNGACDYWEITAGDYPQLRYNAGQSPVMPEGFGTVDEPYLIRNTQDLGTVWSEPTAHYCLEASVDLSGITWSMSIVPWFGGTFEGNGYLISNLHIEGGGYLGLFGQLGPGAEIFDLGLEAADVNGIGSYVGGLVGRNSGNIHTSYNTGAVTGDWYVGGLVGCNADPGNITANYSNSTVSGNLYVGGLVGYNSDNISTCYSTGAVSGASYYIGGLIGSNFGKVTSSLWDIQTSGLAGSDGGVGLTTAEMMDPYMLGLNGFADDPNWILNDSQDYPRLTWEGTPGQTIREPEEIECLEGNGTAEDPYRINTAEQLIYLGRASAICDRYFVLTANIDVDPNLLNGQVFKQAIIPRFTGVCDGNGHIISNLMIMGGSHLGLFGHLGIGAVVKNLGIVDININSSGYSGGLSGRNYGYISNCYITGIVSGLSSVGGLISYNDEIGSITSSYSIGTISGYRDVGGLVSNNSGSVTTSYSKGNVNGDQDVGGLVGFNSGYITTCYSTSRTTGNERVGGLVGYNAYRSSITTCYSTGTVGGDEQVGGLVGYNPGSVNASFWDIQTSRHRTSAGGMGKTTSEMQTASTFLEAGWDFVGETANGTEDIWWIDEGQDYPRLWWELVPEN